ncbi:peroxisomal membrane protein 2 [Tribolium castaneum]|uniref:Peroxisomal membrane protein 2-like Protein n=1 Tax=Tribolium castaneum TaxID=7070 RepID=D6WZN6_TRICA|nr:PREDICTED: peroxisomal membrane protein 2 [Tribolium castaneum]EFA09673.1 Peroxisomal membrane protein 2-like Protein [Tribolium castaneum]|eukprot:XP_973581.1 PREDICTED: peroxisomal membrane protein 2 [Tribolium castaneum]
MVLSKPLFNALGFYFEQLFNHPIRTKAITCCVIATAGNYASQCISGNKVLNQHSLLAYGIFGLLFGGTIPHYFYAWLERVVPEEAAFPIAKKLFLERLIYSPLYQAFTLYVLARLEGKSHEGALDQLQSLYWSVLSSSWKYLTVIHLLNLSVVPPMLRVFIINLVGFFWTIYIANKRRQQAKRDK